MRYDHFDIPPTIPRKLIARHQWRSDMDFERCRLDQRLFGVAYSLLFNGRYEHIPVELVQFRICQRDWYAESG